MELYLIQAIKVTDKQRTDDRSTKFLIKTQLTGAIQSHEHFDVNIIFELKRLIYKLSRFKQVAAY